MAFKLTYKPYGAYAILVEWPQKISKTILEDIILFKQKISVNNIESILEVKNAYNSLLIVYKHKIGNFENVFLTLNKTYNSEVNNIKTPSTLWNIPVCYDETFGLDLEFISKENEIPKTEIIKCHTQTIYTVFFIGFLPGFLYLGGLDEVLHIPRKSSPRLYIEKGAVAIGGNQTGIYPNPSPGGWNVIGNSPINFFDISKKRPCFAKAGDAIKFYPISINEHHDIKTLVNANVYQIESEEING